jgi:putative sigma-54 modulation protein
MDVTNGLKVHIEEGLGRVRAHFDKVIDVDAILTIERHRHIAEFNLHANGLRINAKESSGDMYGSVDAALGKLDKQVAKHKSRIMRHKPRKAREPQDFDHHVIEVPPVAPDRPYSDASGGSHRVVLKEKFSIKPMSVDEAALQLDLQSEHFLVFENAKTDRVNVLYARSDGTYGLIEPPY